MDRRKFRRSKRVTPVKAIIAGFILIFAAAAAYAVYTHFHEPEPEYFEYKGSLITVLEGVAKNEYAAEAFYTDGGFTRYNSADARCGVDVSVYQGEIDWQAVADAGVDFAMIRVGFRGYVDGEIYQDANFTANIDGALAAGLDVGVYFFSQAVTAGEAVKEAEFTISALEGYTLACPVVFDWETISEYEARTDGYSHTATECAAAFCEAVKAADYDPAVYFNVPTGYLIYDLSALCGYRFWLAQYDPYPDFYYDFGIWQYSNTGSVPGIETAVDLDVSFYDYTAPAED